MSYHSFPFAFTSSLMAAVFIVHDISASQNRYQFFSQTF